MSTISELIHQRDRAHERAEAAERRANKLEAQIRFGLTLTCYGCGDSITAATSCDTAPGTQARALVAIVNVHAWYLGTDTVRQLRDMGAGSDVQARAASDICHDCARRGVAAPIE